MIVLFPNLVFYFHWTGFNPTNNRIRIRYSGTEQCISHALTNKDINEIAFIFVIPTSGHFVPALQLNIKGMWCFMKFYIQIFIIVCSGTASMFFCFFYKVSDPDSYNSTLHIRMKIIAKFMVSMLCLHHYQGKYWDPNLYEKCIWSWVYFGGAFLKKYEEKRQRKLTCRLAPSGGIFWRIPGDPIIGQIHKSTIKVFFSRIVSRSVILSKVNSRKLIGNDILRR